MPTTSDPCRTLGVELQIHGHRARLVTHNVFQQFVIGFSLDFYPSVINALRRNPDLVPNIKSLRASDTSRKAAIIPEFLNGCWKPYIEQDPVSEIPFVTEAIDASPPSFANVHCAQTPGIPVHLMFTMP